MTDQYTRHCMLIESRTARYRGKCANCSRSFESAARRRYRPPCQSARRTRVRRRLHRNILHRQQQRREVRPPLRLKDPALNKLATEPLSLAQYVSFERTIRPGLQRQASLVKLGLGQRNVRQPCAPPGQRRYLEGGVATIVVPDTDRLGHVTASIFS